MGATPATDEAIFEELYPPLRRFAAVVADLDVDPDDLVQDALAATLARHRLSDLRRPGAYLRRAILNTAANHRRRAGHLRRLLPKLVPDPATVDAYPSDLSILDQLDPTDRAVLYLADVARLRHTEIASELGISESAVRKRASRGRRRLRDAERTGIPTTMGEAP